jgi:hypothetical protein
MIFKKLVKNLKNSPQCGERYFIMKHLVLLIAAIMTITGLVSEVRAGVEHAPTVSLIDSYDEDSLREVAEELVVEHLEGYTITTFVTKTKVGIHNLLPDNKYAAVFIRIARDSWAFFDNGDEMQIPKKAEVKIYSSGNAAYFRDDEFMIANSFENAKPVRRIGKRELEEMAETIELSRNEYGKGLTSYDLILNKDVLFLSGPGSAFVSIEGGEQSIIPSKGLLGLPKGAGLYYTTYYCFPDNKSVCAPSCIPPRK